MAEDYNPDLISLTDEDGKQFDFEVIDAIETDDNRYLALTPVFSDAADKVNDSGELVIVRELEENGEFYFEEIEDDDEYETVAELFVDRLKDVFEIEDI
jgi:hypothetical protein